MCKAHVLRFCCGHGLLMSIEPCKMCPCAILKTTGVGLARLPYRCYNCQHKLSSLPITPVTSRDSTCASSLESLTSEKTTSTSTTSTSISTTSSLSSSRPALKSRMLSSPLPQISHPLPGVARQPSGSVQYCHRYDRQSSFSTKPFRFACSSSSHFPTPHYATLPSFLPHQDHLCPPCQLAELRAHGARHALSVATKDFLRFRSETLIINGQSQEDSPWFRQLTLPDYVEEKVLEEKQLWLGVTRMWVQILTRARVLVAEEDGLGLFG